MKNTRFALVSIILLTVVIGCKKDEPSQTHWYLQPSGVTQYLNSVLITQDNTGFAVGDYGVILKSTAGGSTWTSLESSTTDKLTSVCFPNAGTGYIAGHRGIYLKTDNGGYTWTNHHLTTTYDFNAVFFVDPNIGYLAADWVNDFTREFISGGEIFKTTDGGGSWVPCHAGVYTSLRSLYFLDANEGYAVGQNGTIVKTTDGALTWEILTSGTVNDLTSVTFVSRNTGFAAGGDPSGNSGEILKTEDSGHTWSSILTDTRSITSVSFLDTNLGYVTSSDNSLNGIILKTDNGGSTWNLEETGIVFPYLNSIYFSNSDAVLAVGANGTILKFGK